MGVLVAICAGRAGIRRENLGQWRAADPWLDAEIEKARMQAAEAAWKDIMAYGKSGAPNAWQSTAWRLERSHPESFGRPEVQLNAQFNSQTNVSATIIISTEVAENLQRRNKLIDEELDALAKSHEAKQKLLNGTNGDVIREVESSSSLVPNNSVITLPSSAAGRTRAWWSQLSCGDGSRSLTASAADYALRAVVTDVAGAARASALKVSWYNELPILADLWTALERACVPDGL